MAQARTRAERGSVNQVKVEILQKISKNAPRDFKPPGLGIAGLKCGHEIADLKSGQVAPHLREPYFCPYFCQFSLPFQF